MYVIEAACGCDTGKNRGNNEDNFYFDGKHLEVDHDGLWPPLCIQVPVRNGLCFAVFDGMGGENFGEYASFAAARELRQARRRFFERLFLGTEYLSKLSRRLNEAVFRAGRELGTNRMGSTMAALHFAGSEVYACNVGDSRVYRLREGTFLQLSRDHVEAAPVRAGKKPALTRCLGMDPEEFLVEPHIAREAVRRGDRYLLCSDGLTDMLTNSEISDIMLGGADPDSCVRALIRASLERGGRDNITVIVCRID